MSIDFDDLEPGISADEEARGAKRIIQIGFGVLLIGAGILMLVIPGPGLVSIMVGLNLIKPDNAIVRWMRRKIPGIPEAGAVPRSYLFVGAAFLIGSTLGGVLYGAAATDWLLEVSGIR